jgi:hypothetical protein
VPQKTDAVGVEVIFYGRTYAEQAQTRAELDRVLAGELAAARASLRDSAATVLRRYTMFAASDSVQDRFEDAAGEDAGGDRGWRERAMDRLHVNYLQRVCAKNDTFSEFGPTAWGRINPEVAGARLAPEPGVARRDVYLEKWLIVALAHAMTADPAVLDEVCPRVHPNGMLEGDAFVRDDTGAEIRIDAAARELLARCDGNTPAWQLAEPARLADLVRDGVIVWAIEPLGMEGHRLGFLIDDVRRWRDAAGRQRWLPILEELEAFRSAFAASLEVEPRTEILATLERRIVELGLERRKRKRTLYAAANALGEECLREAHFELGGSIAAHFLDDAGPWLDLFCDIRAYVRSEVMQQVRALWRSAPRRGGRLSLPAFFRHAASSGVALDADGIGQLARAPYRTALDAFSASLGERANEPELELTTEDCHAIRRLFKFDPSRFAWPNVDLQLSARSLDALNAGEYELVIGELGEPCVIASHAFFWGCPDPAALGRDFRRIIAPPRVCATSLKVIDRGVHVIFRWQDLLGDRFTAVVPERMRPGVRHVAPIDVDIRLDETDDELYVMRGEENLGPFVSEWDIPFTLGVHPFVFKRAPHLSRLRRGRTVLQRRQWIVRAEELPGGPYSGTSGALIAAVERLRSARGLPRHVFIRPPENVLGNRHSGEGRDKDVKPFYVDLESYLFLEAFHHHLTKHRELEIVEMLPAPDQLFWREADGRRTFEMRTVLGPSNGPSNGAR